MGFIHKNRGIRGIMRDQTHLHGLRDVLYSGNAVSKELHYSVITITFPWEPLSKKGWLPSCLVFLLLGFFFFFFGENLKFSYAVWQCQWNTILSNTACIFQHILKADTKYLLPFYLGNHRHPGLPLCRNTGMCYRWMINNICNHIMQNISIREWC